MARARMTPSSTSPADARDASLLSGDELGGSIMAMDADHGSVPVVHHPAITSGSPATSVAARLRGRKWSSSPAAAAAAAAAAASRCRMRPVDAVMIVFLLAETWSSVCFKKVAIFMVNYPFFLTELSPVIGLPIYAVGTALLYGLGRLPPSKRNLRWYQPCIIGGLYGLHNLFGSFGNRGNTVPGPYVILITQLKIPITLALSWGWLRVRYTRFQLAASCVVIVGVICSLWTRLVALAPGEELALTSLVLQTFPYALAIVYMERLMKAQGPDVCYMLLWICCFETVLTLALAPLNAWLQELSLSEAMPNLWAGIKCFFAAVNSAPGDQCEDFSPLLLFLLGLPGGVAFNLCLGYGVLHGSASYLWLVYALLIPLTSILFVLRPLMGQYATVFHPLDIVGLIIVMIGIAAYRRATTVAEQSPLQYETLPAVVEGP